MAETPCAGQSGNRCLACLCRLSRRLRCRVLRAGGRSGRARRGPAHGVGAALLRDALLRVLNAAREIGAAAILVHALNDRAKAFYLEHGFVESPIEPLVLMLPVKDIAAALREG